MAGAGAGVGARAEIMVKFGAGAENKYFRIQNTDVDQSTSNTGLVPILLFSFCTSIVKV